MKTISIINLKGGVAKTISAANIAHILATVHNKRVLLVDNDKQGNISKMFGVHSYDNMSITDILMERFNDIHEIITPSQFIRLDIIPANMTLLEANTIEKEKHRQTRLRTAFKGIAGVYDYCVIDNAPDLNMSTINALVASDDVIIPIKIDKFAFDGLAELAEQINNICSNKELNSRLALKGCFITSYQSIERVSLILAGVPGGAEKALSRVIDRARSTVRTTALKGITNVYAITQKDVRAETNINMHTRKENSGIVGEVWFSGAAIPLYRFNVTPKTPTPRTSEHVRAGVLKGRQTLLKNAFVALMTSGHYGVFERVSGKYMEARGGKKNKHTQAIGNGIYDQFYGPSTAQMAANSVVLSEVEDAAMDTINKRLEHEISRLLNGYD